MNNKTKIWTNYGFFKTYNAVQNKIKELGNKFQLYKIRLVKEYGKEGWFKLKVWNPRKNKKN